MNSLEYENLVKQIITELYKNAEKPIAPDVPVARGRTNKWLGISGFQHQIDVSVDGSQNILLIECKSWKKKVDVPRFLTFLARFLDIKEQEIGRTIHPIVVTTVGFQKGIEVLAEYYDVKTNLVSSASEFAVHYKNFGFLGVTDKGIGTDSVRLDKYDQRGNCF